MVLFLGMYFQNGPNSSEGYPKVSLYEAALTTDCCPNTSVLMEMGIQRRKICLQFQAGVPAIAVGRCLPKGKSLLWENSRILPLKISCKFSLSKTSCKH